MTNRLLACIGVCVLLSPVFTGVSQAFTEFGDQPTVGGDPVFATKADVMISAVKSLIEAKDYEGAEKLALEVTEKAPDNPDGWMMLAYAQSLNAKYVLSNESYDKAMEYGAEVKDVLARKAYNCRKLQNSEQTRECYKGILEVDPHNVDILMQLGKFEGTLENVDAAARYFETVLSIDPNHLEAVEAMSRVEATRGSPAQQKYWLEKGLSLDPANTKYLKRLSSIYLNEQNYGLSIHYLDKLLSIDPTDAGAFRNKGIAHYQQGDKQEATKAFEMVRSLGDKMEGLYGPLADCYRSTGASSKALEVIKEGLEARNQEAWLLSIWGKILEDGKNYDAAINKFNRAVLLNDEPWSGYAKKQIARQAQLKKRAAMIAAQGADQ